MELEHVAASTKSLGGLPGMSTFDEDVNLL